MKRVNGFTLIEVMVALFVAAVTLSALMVQTSRVIDSTVYLKEKTIANWVALNQLETMRIQNRQTNTMPTQERNGSEEMAGRTWFWQVKPVRTANDGFLQLEVRVAKDQDLEDVVVTFIGLVDTFPRRQC